MTRARPLRLLALLLAVGPVGCATQADIQDIEVEQRRIRTQLADTRATLESVQRDLAKIRGGVEEMRYSSRRGPNRMDRIEERVRAIEQGRTPPATSTDGTSGTSTATEPGLEGELSVAPVPTPTPVAAPREIAATDLAREEARDIPDEYRRGLTLLRQGAYDRAIQAFRDFLRTNRDSPLSPNAHYWIGESYYVLGDYYQAILNFNDVRQQYARSERAPAAILKIGLAFQQMGNKSEARLAFQKVVNDYPSSPEAAQARERLQSLGA